MEPLHTDYSNDDTDDSASESPCVAKTASDDTSQCLKEVVGGIVGIVADALDELGLMPGSRWMDGGP